VKGRTLDTAVVNIDVFTSAAIFMINEHDVTHLYFAVNFYFIFGMVSFRFGVIVRVPELVFTFWDERYFMWSQRTDNIYSTHRNSS